MGSAARRQLAEGLPITRGLRRAAPPPPHHAPPPLLQEAHAKGLVNGKATFLGADKYGAVLKAFCYGKNKASVAALFSLQAFFNGLAFPLGDKNVALIVAVFQKLYADDIMEEEPMQVRGVAVVGGCWRGATS